MPGRCRLSGGSGRSHIQNGCVVPLTGEARTVLHAGPFPSPADFQDSHSRSQEATADFTERPRSRDGRFAGQPRARHGRPEKFHCR